VQPFKMTQREMPHMGAIHPRYSPYREIPTTSETNLDPPDFQATPSELLEGANLSFRAGVRFGTRIINLRRQGPAVFESRWRQSSEDIPPFGWV